MATSHCPGYRHLDFIPAMELSPSTQSLRTRMSCDLCTNSKLKCSQERPACRRCVRRGLKDSCSYSTARRPGRRKRSQVGSTCTFTVHDHTPGRNKGGNPASDPRTTTDDQASNLLGQSDEQPVDESTGPSEIHEDPFHAMLSTPSDGVWISEGVADDIWNDEWQCIIDRCSQSWRESTLR